MEKLNELIGFVLPGATVKIRPAPDAVEGDPWPGIEDSDAAMQTALDTLVVWRDGVTPPTGAALRAQIAAWRAYTPPPPPPTPEDEMHAAIASAGTVEELKAALLGQAGAARVAGRAV